MKILISNWLDIYLFALGVCIILISLNPWWQIESWFIFTLIGFLSIISSGIAHKE